MFWLCDCFFFRAPAIGIKLKFLKTCEPLSFHKFFKSMSQEVQCTWYPEIYDCFGVGYLNYSHALQVLKHPDFDVHVQGCAQVSVLFAIEQCLSYNVDCQCYWKPEDEQVKQMFELYDLACEKYAKSLPGHSSRRTVANMTYGVTQTMETVKRILNKYNIAYAISEC